MNAGPSTLELVDTALGQPPSHPHCSGRMPGRDAKTSGPNSSVGCGSNHVAVYSESSHVVEGGGDCQVPCWVTNSWKNSESMKDHNSITSLSLQEAFLCPYACYT